MITETMTDIEIYEETRGAFRMKRRSCSLSIK